ncbi:MAG: DUF2934 domain-containing protein [Proteobacteria bacterium]|nr:DUF2934 domain-containing protein [Pseudomonadota bacterium]
MPKGPTVAELEERKRQLAYQFWEEEGRPAGRSEVHWQRACLALAPAAASPAKKASAVAAPKATAAKVKPPAKAVSSRSKAR